MGELAALGADLSGTIENLGHADVRSGWNRQVRCESNERHEYLGRP